MAYEFHMADDGILWLTVIGDFGQEDAQACSESAPFQKDTRSALLLLLVDTRRSGKVESRARKTMIELIRGNREGKVAVLGLSRYVRVLVGFVNKATGRDNVRLFGSEEEALAWLKGAV